MDATFLKYGLACVAVLAFTGWNRHVSMRAFQFAWMLAAICLVTNVLNHTLYYPTALVPYSPIDGVAGILVSLSFWHKPRVWKLALATSFLCMGAIHTLFWYGQTHGQGYEAVAPYMDRLSVVFKLQLALVCIPGGIERVRQFLAWCSAHILPLLRRPMPNGSVRHKGKEA